MIRLLPMTHNFPPQPTECPIGQAGFRPVRTLILPMTVQGPRGPIRGYMRAEYGSTLHEQATRAEFRRHVEDLTTPSRFDEILRAARGRQAAASHHGD